MKTFVKNFHQLLQIMVMKICGKLGKVRELFSTIQNIPHMYIDRQFPPEVLMVISGYVKIDFNY